MGTRIRNRVIGKTVGETIDNTRTYLEENRSAIYAGAVGFLCGGFVVLAFSHRNSQVRVVVENRTVYLNAERML